MLLHLISTATICPKSAFSRINHFRWFSLISLFLFFPAFAQATTYYVDATAGNDANTGTTITAPWKTIAKVNATKFMAGDFILFKSGCTWQEQLTVQSSGNADNPITFGAYSTGAKPVISGADKVGASGWTLYSGKIYVTTIGTGYAPNQLFVDGIYYDVAHHPNSGWLLATANSSSTTSIVSNNPTFSAAQVVGATVMAKAVRWNISTNAATAYDPGTGSITLSGNVYDSSVFMSTGYGFYLINKLWMLDSPGEWYYDQSTGKLYLWTIGGDTPSAHRVEISARNYGILISGKNFITIQDLVVSNTNRNNINISGSNYITVKKTDISGGVTGIFCNGSTYCSIEENRINNTIREGINITWNSVISDSNNHYVSNNTLDNNGNVGFTPKYSLASMSVAGVSIKLSGNIISNSGRNGIYFTGDEIVVTDNIVDKVCNMLDDCAGIYTYPRSSNSNNTISRNVVTNSVGNNTGTVKTTTFSNGIYLDDFSHDTVVSGNTVSNADYGIFIHTGYNNTVTGNVVYGARTSGFMINENSSGAVPGSAHGNVVTDNTFETASTGSAAIYFSTIETATNFGTYDRNHYFHPNTDYVINNQYRNYTLNDWKAFSNQDLNSTDAKSYVGRPDAPTITLTATPVAVVPGESATINWSSRNAISCVADGDWAGNKAVAGSFTTNNLTSTATYTLTCYGTSASTTSTVKIPIQSLNLKLLQ